MSKTSIKTTEPTTDNFLLKMKEFYETKDQRSSRTSSQKKNHAK